jgi:hypothetical protein
LRAFRRIGVLRGASGTFRSKFEFGDRFSLVAACSLMPSKAQRKTGRPWSKVVFPQAPSIS